MNMKGAEQLGINAKKQKPEKNIYIINPNKSQPTKNKNSKKQKN